MTPEEIEQLLEHRLGQFSVRITRFRSAITCDFKLPFERVRPISSCIEFTCNDIGEWSLSSFTVRTPRIHSTQGQGVLEEIFWTALSGTAPPGYSVRVTPCGNGEYDPHILLTKCDLEESLEFISTYAQAQFNTGFAELT